MRGWRGEYECVSLKRARTVASSPSRSWTRQAPTRRSRFTRFVVVVEHNYSYPTSTRVRSSVLYRYDIALLFYRFSVVFSSFTTLFAVAKPRRCWPSPRVQNESSVAGDARNPRPTRTRGSHARYIHGDPRDHATNSFIFLSILTVTRCVDN